MKKICVLETHSAICYGFLSNNIARGKTEVMIKIHHRTSLSIFRFTTDEAKCFTFHDQ